VKFEVLLALNIVTMLLLLCHDVKCVRYMAAFQSNLLPATP